VRSRFGVDHVSGCRVEDLWVYHCRGLVVEELAR
jgi:hypothetical protein